MVRPILELRAAYKLLIAISLSGLEVRDISLAWLGLA